MCIRDRWLKLCWNIPPEHSAEPGNIFFYTDIDGKSDDSESDNAPYWSVSLDFTYNYSAERYAATGASLVFDVDRDLSHCQSICEIIYFWNEQGTWV